MPDANCPFSSDIVASRLEIQKTKMKSQNDFLETSLTSQSSYVYGPLYHGIPTKEGEVTDFLGERSS